MKFKETGNGWIEMNTEEVRFEILPGGIDCDDEWLLISPLFGTLRQKLGFKAGDDMRKVKREAVKVIRNKIIAMRRSLDDIEY